MDAGEASDWHARSMSHDEPPSENGSLRLPPEILVEIFTHCLPPDSVRLSMPPQLLPPLILSRVCAYWHRLVLSSPHLWNRIVLGRYETDSAREMSVFDAWLARAGSERIPLDIKLIQQSRDALQVILDREANDRYERDTHTLIAKFCANAYRLRTLVLDVLDADVLEPLFATLCAELGSSDSSSTAAAPLLEELKISTTHLGAWSGARTLHHIALTCPRLRNVSLMCPPLVPSPAGRPETQVLQHMRVLELRFCTAVAHALNWLDVCPNLERLNVTLFCRSSEDEEDPEIDEFDGLDDGGWVLVRNPRPRPVPGMSNRDVRCLTRLTHLELRSFSFPAPVGTIIDSLVTPALKTLKISTSISRVGPSYARWLHVPALLQRSDAPLEELEISGSPMNVEDVRACLMLSPRLKRLSVGKLEELNTLLGDLTVPKSEPELSAANRVPKDGSAQSAPIGTHTLLCPELEMLDIANSSFSVDVLASMISSRFALPQKLSESDGLDISRCTRLKELRVDMTTTSTVVAHPVIATCISQGLKLTELEPNPLLSLRID